MRTPVVKRPTLPESGCCQFFPLWLSRAQSIPGHVFRLHCRRLVHQRRCTTHVWRCSRHGHGECRDRSGGARRPRHISVPSYRPLQRDGATATVGQFVPGSGEGQHTSTRHGLSPSMLEPERMSNQRDGLRVNGRCAPWRSRRRTCVMTEPYPAAHPMVVQ
jgi:hypothetical protein